VRWRRSPGALWRAVPGYLVLATVDGRTLEVEGPGGDVWAGLEAWTAEEDLAADLAERYGTDPSIVATDVRALLEQLHRQGYVDRSA
jgi:hypothetical protein